MDLFQCKADKDALLVIRDPIVKNASGLVIGILLTHPDQIVGGAVQNIEKIGRKEGVPVDIAVLDNGLTAVSYAQMLQAKYEDDHMILVQASVYVPFSFLENVRSLIQYFSDKSVPWGAIGNSGICFPYFKPVCNILVAHAPLERFASALPAAHLDPYLLLIHRNVKLSTFAGIADCRRDAPLNDLVGLAAWEAGMPCWICNLPVYVSGTSATSQTGGDRNAWVRYLSMHYNNASFVSSFGTLAIDDHATNGKDYYYGQMEPVLDAATKAYDKTSLSVLLFATYHDLDIFDRCLMSIVSQFQRPENLYIIGLEKLEDRRRFQFKEVIERYRHYIPVHWGEEELPDSHAADQLCEYLRRSPEYGYSLCAYDTFVLFPQAVRQICEFFQICLGDRNVLPITTVEVSRLRRAVESRIPSRPQAFFKEVEKIGFSHKESWFSSQSSSILHFTFPNSFLSKIGASELDLTDLGSCLPQRLLAEPFSFFLIERGAGYMSFQKPSPDETISPLREEGTPYHLANKANSLLAAGSNILQYYMKGDEIMPSISYQDGSEGSWRQKGNSLRLEELEAFNGYAEQELARLQQFIQQQEMTLKQQGEALNRFVNTWHYKAGKHILKASRFLRNYFRKRTNWRSGS